MSRNIVCFVFMFCVLLLFSGCVEPGNKSNMLKRIKQTQDETTLSFNGIISVPFETNDASKKEFEKLRLTIKIHSEVASRKPLRSNYTAQFSINANDNESEPVFSIKISGTCDGSSKRGIEEAFSLFEKAANSTKGLILTREFMAELKKKLQDDRKYIYLVSPEN